MEQPRVAPTSQCMRRTSALSSLLVATTLRGLPATARRWQSKWLVKPLCGIEQVATPQPFGATAEVGLLSYNRSPLPGSQVWDRLTQGLLATTVSSSHRTRPLPPRPPPHPVRLYGSLRRRLVQGRHDGLLSHASNGLHRRRPLQRPSGPCGHSGRHVEWRVDHPLPCPVVAGDGSAGRSSSSANKGTY